jgi:alpha-tubulin suppressor-like RCC1 family protein
VRFESHTCGVTPAGRIDCWGANGFGQLGNGGFDDAAVPIPVMVPPGVEFREVSAGGHHTCALSADFDVYCWGANGRGQLGADTAFQSTPFPVRVFNVGTFTSLSAGGFFTCGSNPDVTSCWGDNRWGQLGSGTPGGFSILPLTVRASVDGVSAGFEHACAIGISNEARCWGRADLLQLGSTLALETCLGIDCSSSPLEVVGFWSFRQVSAGGTHTCGLTQNHLVLCWGDNENGQLGLGTRSTAEFPNATTVLAGETTLPGRVGRTLRIERRGRAVTAGGNHSCALAQNSAPFCWGRNDFGQVGAGPALFSHLRPVEIER